MTPFGIALPARILFGRGEAAKAPGLIAPLGSRVVVVHGANPARSVWLVDALRLARISVMTLSCGAEPTLAMVEEAVESARAFGAQTVVAIGGGAVMDLGKAIAALVPAPGSAMDHLEVVGRGLPLVASPLPFVALPTTSGTGSEATRNAVIGLPEHGRKVSLRDDRMLARLAIVDPALTDGCPRAVTLASGLDAITQVIEPYLCNRATPFVDALTWPAIARGMAALMRLMEGEDAKARDDLAWVSLCGGVALANAGLGAVHGLAGVIGGMTPAAHGAVCGVLLGPVLEANRRETSGSARARVDAVCAVLGDALGVDAQAAPGALADWARAAGLPGLSAQGLATADHARVADAAQDASSMKANPVALTSDMLRDVLAIAG